MAFRRTVITTCSVAVCNMTLAKTSHLDDVTGITSHRPPCLGEHHMLKLALPGIVVGYVMGQHNQLEIL